jgi:hypothetical protein
MAAQDEARAVTLAPGGSLGHHRCVPRLRRALALAVLAALAAAGCRREDPLPPLPAPTEDAGSNTVEESFDELYPVFLMRKVAPGPKAQLWTRYAHKWVRWTGTLVSFTRNGATFKHIPSTVTFDVSLYVDAPGREKLKQLKPGQTVTYVGQLDSYDDIFRTFYLVHGDVAAK